MTEPDDDFLIKLAAALKQAANPNVTQSLASGLLWACYPEWFNQMYLPWVQKKRALEGKGK